MSVHCKIRQIKNLTILPRSKKDRQGNIIAINVMATGKFVMQYKVIKIGWYETEVQAMIFLDYGDAFK